MKILVYLKLIAVICATGTKSEETCESYDTKPIIIDGVLPRFIGEIGSFLISDAESVKISDDALFLAYFSAELQENKIVISTTENFTDYEKQNSQPRPSIPLDIRCISSQVSKPNVRITIAEVNNFAPEFIATSLEIKIPTPIAKGFEITSVLGLDDKITAIDYDLYKNELKFAITGTEIFTVEAILINGSKPSYEARIFTKQQILKLENDEIEFSLTATDSFEEPEATTVKVRLFTDPEISFIESPRFLQPFYKGSIKINKTLQIEDIELIESTYDENVKFEVINDEYGIIEISNDGPKVLISLNEEKISDEIFNKKFINFVIAARREGDKSGNAVVILEITSTVSNSAFEKSLYVGQITDDKVLELEDILIESETQFTKSDVTGNDAEYFEAVLEGNIIKINLRKEITQELLLQKTILNAKISAEDDDSFISTNLIVTLPRINVGKKLVFETLKTIGYIKFEPALTLEIDQVTLQQNSYDEKVSFNVTENDASFFDFDKFTNKIQLKIRPEINEESIKQRDFLTLNILASREGYEDAEHVVLVLVTKYIEETTTSTFEKSLYIGEVDNQKKLHVDPIIIKSDYQYEDVKLSGGDSQYFTALITQNDVTIKLIEEITEDLLIRKSILSTEIIAEYEHSLISTNLIVKLPKVNGDKFLKFEKPYYMGVVNELELAIPEIILELNNYDPSIEFIITGTNENFFQFERNQNSLRLKLATGITEEHLKDFVFLTAAITASREEFVTAETAIFVHVVDSEDISSIEFDSPVYRGTLTFNNVLTVERIAITSDENQIEFSHKGEHSEKFKMNYENFKDIKVQFIEQPIDFNQKFYYFYIEALKYGASKAYATVIIEIVDKRQLTFENIHYFGTIDAQQNLSIEEIPISSEMTASGITFRLTEGQNQFFDFTLNSNSIQITLKMPVSIKNSNFLWFYLEVFGNEYYSDRTLLIIELPKEFDNPIEDCKHNNDPTQPFFETGSYSFTIINDEIGSIGKIQALIIDPEDSIISYTIEFENNYLNDKVTIRGGDIIVTKPITTGFYQMIGIAFSKNSQKSARTNILLRVLEAKTCENGKSLTTVQKVLAIEKIEENEIYDHIMHTKIDDCEYDIETISPNDLNAHIEIDKSTHYIKNVKPLIEKVSILKAFTFLKFKLN